MILKSKSRGVFADDTAWVRLLAVGILPLVPIFPIVPIVVTRSDWAFLGVVTDGWKAGYTSDRTTQSLGFLLWLGHNWGIHDGHLYHLPSVQNPKSLPLFCQLLYNQKVFKIIKQNMPLLTQEEYSKIKHKTPYVYKIQNKTQFLYYFGEKHSFDPNDAQWTQAKEFWFDFVKNTENQKKIAFVEAGRPSVEKTEEKAILEAGGTGLIIFLASQLNIEVYCPEPNRTHEMQELERQFSREEIEYYFFARIVHQWGKIPDPKPNFEEYITRFLERDKKVSGWDDFDFSFENLKIIHKKLFNTEFDLEDPNFFKDLVTPVELKTIINKVARASGKKRNEYIIKKICKYWNNGYSIFIEYGASHAVIQEPLLKEVLIKILKKESRITLKMTRL